MENINLKHLPPISETFRAFEKSLGFKNDIKWTSAILLTLYHIAAVYWCYHYALPVKMQTVIFAAIMYVATGFGITGGAHRLWTHKSYKATLPLKLFLLMCFASAGQNSLEQWVRDHRLHHKHSDTNADPHNANRGLFFSHIGWLMMKKNKEVIIRGKQMDMTDIHEDPILRFYNKHFAYFRLLFCFVLPFMVNVYILKESWQCTIAWQWFIRFLSMFHSELTVNSLAHAYGYRPYNKNIVPRENRFVATCTLGEGWHNYHHAFPFDYKAAEHFDLFNWGTLFIQAFEKLGLAYGLRMATPEMISNLSNRLGESAQ
ncbi:unnamed protein product [Danaus chrysippus]|uniref:(African queen) hypothetical protein n=1 Tax=Danaus chrysippus TaxID=151541 RepID=A0A8J2QVK5_9NEOP|nr:unnamed protein product [Danaus chrysippus]